MAQLGGLPVGRAAAARRPRGRGRLQCGAAKSKAERCRGQGRPGNGVAAARRSGTHRGRKRHADAEGYRRHGLLPLVERPAGPIPATCRRAGRRVHADEGRLPRHGARAETGRVLVVRSVDRQAAGRSHPARAVRQRHDRPRRRREGDRRHGGVYSRDHRPRGRRHQRLERRVGDAVVRVGRAGPALFLGGEVARCPAVRRGCG